MVRYERTGEYRPPKKGEWFSLEGVAQTGAPPLLPQECFIEHWTRDVFILRRVETEEGANDE